MKKTLFSTAVVTLAALMLPMTVLVAASISEAQRDYMAGRYAEAKIKFSQILAENPSNAVARNYLRMIDTAEKQAEKQQLAGQLRSIVVPNVALRDATFESVIELLPTLAEKYSNGAVKPSFVVEQGVNRERVVTLQLSNVPYTEVLRYVGMQAGVAFKIEQYAVRVSPKAPEGGTVTDAATAVGEP